MWVASAAADPPDEFLQVTAVFDDASDTIPLYVNGGAAAISVLDEASRGGPPVVRALARAARRARGEDVEER